MMLWKSKSSIPATSAIIYYNKNSLYTVFLEELKIIITKDYYN